MLGLEIGEGVLAAVATGKSQIVLEHHGHFVHVLAHRFDLGTVADQRKLQLETG